MVLLESLTNEVRAEESCGFLDAEYKKEKPKGLLVRMDSPITEADRQTLDHIIAKLSKEKKPHNGVNKKTRILLVSETNNACLSLSSSDDENEEGGEPDLHQCGHCRQMFYNFTKYITHKLQKVCWNADATPTDDVTAWPIENNGLSSPGEKEDLEGEIEGNIEVENLNQDLQKKKHRKGMVRRLKPSEEALVDTASNEPIVFVPADEETVYVQAENVEETKAKSLIDVREHQGKEDVPMETQDDTDQPIRASSSKYGVSLYNFSKTKKPGYLNPSGRDTEYIASPKNVRSPQNLASPHGYQRGQYPQKYYHGGPKQPNTQGRYVDAYDAYAKYRNPRYYDDPPTSFYPPHHRTNKGLPYYRGDDRYKTDSYLPYDKYRTMATLPPDDKMAQQHDSAAKINAKVKNNGKGSEKSNTNDNTENGVNDITFDTADPPQLVRVSPNTVQGEAEKTSTYDKSPPALEKCESSFAEGDSLKVEEEESRDSILDTEESKINESQPEDTVHLTKFASMSPDKESNSPQGSTNSHETEDYSQDNTNKEPGSQLEAWSQPKQTLQRPTSVQASNKPYKSISPDKESNSPLGSTNSHETEDYTQDNTNRDSQEFRLPRHRQLSESTVERMITEPCPQSDASWKHAKQVYRCPLCAKIFPFKSKLQRHVLVHTGIKPYKCTVCGRGFTQQIDLQRHLTRHTGEKPFKCHLCKAQFIRADNLRKHCKDAHFVSIEEPIRKRRRKTTGSDTVLPPLEVAIALALSETERNGGRVLGRAATRTNTRTTSSSKQPRYPAENTFPQPPPRPDDVHQTTYPPRMASRTEVAPYPSNYPPQLGPRQNVRYPFHHGPEGGPPGPGYPRSPSEFHPNSPPYHRNDPRYMQAGEPPVRYYSQAPPGRGYYMRPGFEREGEVFEDGRSGPPTPSPQGHPFKVQDYRSMAFDQQQPPSGYPVKRPAERSGRPRSEDVEYGPPESRKRDEDYGERPPEKSSYRVNPAQKHSPAEYIQPREREGDSPSYRGAEDGQRTKNPYTLPAPRAEDDHRAVFRGKPSISYGDYAGGAAARSSEASMVNRGEYRGELGSSQRPDPEEFGTMAGAEKDSNLIEPRPISPISGVGGDAAVQDTGNVYVDEEETPIVTPSDDHMLTSEP